jgi:hypothetical protein
MFAILSVDDFKSNNFIIVFGLSLPFFSSSLALLICFILSKSLLDISFFILEIESVKVFSSSVVNFFFVAKFFNDLILSSILYLSL